jgi:hypothetical protein
VPLFLVLLEYEYKEEEEETQQEEEEERHWAIKTQHDEKGQRKREKDPLFVEIYNDYHLPMMKLKRDKTRKIYVYAYRQCDVVYYFSLWCVVGPIC